MTDGPGPLPPEGAQRPDERSDEQGRTPAWAQPEPAEPDESQYDAWLEQQDELLEPPAAEDGTPAEPPGAEPVEPEPEAAEPTEPAEPQPVDPELRPAAAPSEPQAADVEPDAVAPQGDALEPAGEPGAESVPVDRLPEEPPVADDGPPVDDVVAVEQAGTDGDEEHDAAAVGEPTGAEAAVPVPVTAEPPAAEVPLEPFPGQYGETHADDEADPDGEADGEADAGADGTVRAGRSAAALVWSLVAVVVVLALLTAFLAVLSVRTRGGGATEDARRDALAASRSAARVVFSYDYRHLAKDFAAGKKVTTGDFAKEYARTTSRLVDDVAGKYKAVVVADISDAAVVSAGKDKVVTLVFLSQQSTSTLATGTKITQSRLEMTMVHRKGQWLVEKIRAF
ncbi:MAG TPA: hypothetical protein VMZ11_00795 [Mycobacteriales bacterium]|nr:hypothetical protein [Mycobacteriales bacterium]